MAKQMKLSRTRTSGAGARALTSMLAEASSYCSAADRDERRGFRYTAAMEWRKAAELLAPVPTMAERCWREWERIMQLPRRLAEPIRSHDDSPATGYEADDLRLCA
jgi:hypothetical protein